MCLQELNEEESQLQFLKALWLQKEWLSLPQKTVE